MTTRANCHLCGQEIQFTTGNPIELGLHMMQHHSKGSVCQYTVPDEKDDCPSKPVTPLTGCAGGCRERGGRWPKKRKKMYNRGLYKTTLETWTAGCGFITCPNCKEEVKPLIRSQKNKVAYTSLGATFLLSCWPFCFLCPMMHRCSVDLYCPNCKYKLGVYDSSTGRTEAARNETRNIPNINPNPKCLP